MSVSWIQYIKVIYILPFYCITQTWWGSDGDCYIDLTDVMLPNQKSIKSSSKAMCCVIINALYKLETWFTWNDNVNRILTSSKWFICCYVSSETHCEHTFTKDADCKISKEGCLACIICTLLNASLFKSMSSTWCMKDSDWQIFNVLSHPKNTA